MTPNEFIHLANTLDYETYPTLSDPNLLRLANIGLGITSEAGEIADCLKKTLVFGKDLDIDNLKEECGDILWYIAVLLKTINSSFEEVMEMNVEKLATRYPTGTFKVSDALAKIDKK